MTEDIELLRSFARDRSEAAFAELVRRHIDLVYAFALRRVNGDAHLADDVTQCVFADLARKAPTLQDRSVLLTGWLYTSTRFAAAKAVRSEQRRRTHEQEAHSMQELHSEPAPAWEQLRPVLDNVMDQLREPDREALLLRFFEGRPLVEIGRRLAVSEDAARMRVDRALEKTRNLLARHGITSTSAALSGALSAFGGVTAPAGLSATTINTALSAVASGAQGAGLLGGFALMSYLKSTLTVSVLVMAGILTYDLAALRRVERVALQRAGNVKESVQLEKRRAFLAGRLGTLERQIAQLESARATPPAASPAAFVSPTQPWLSDPTYRGLYSVAQQARHHVEFQDFYRELALPAPAIEKFEALMVQQDLANKDVQIARDLGQDETPINEGSGSIWNAGMDELLGPQGKARLEDYLRSMPVREFVNNLATLSNDPITPEQAARIAALALENDPTYQSGKGTDQGTPNWSAVWQPAVAIVSPEQLAPLQMLVEMRRLKTQIQQGLAATPAATP